MYPKSSSTRCNAICLSLMLSFNVLKQDLRYLTYIVLIIRLFHCLSVDVGNKIGEPGAKALLYALRDQTSLPLPTTVIKVPNTGLLRLCVQVLYVVYSSTPAIFLCLTCRCFTNRKDLCIVKDPAPTLVCI